MPEFWEIVLGTVAILSAGVMLHARFRVFGNRKYWEIYALALFAWLPTWIIGSFIWQPATGHASYGYPWFFVYLFLLGGALAFIFLVTRRDWVYVIKGIGLVLAVIAIWNLGWFTFHVPFTPDGVHWRHSNLSLWVWLGLMALVVLMMIVMARTINYIIGAFLLVVLLVFAAVWGFGLFDNGSNAKHNSSSTHKKTSGSGSTSKAAQQQVTVEGLYEPTTTHLTQVAQSLGYHYMTVNGATTPVFAYGSMAPVGNGGRLWSDAVNKPLTVRTPEAEEAVVSVDPAQAAMVMNGLGSQPVGDKTVAQLNPWMVAQGSPSTIATWAQSCRTDNVAVHLQCAQTMSLAAELLTRLSGQGVVVSDSVWNYHLANGGLVVGKVPAFELNRVQEHQNHFLELALTEKTGGCWLRIGFNVGVQSVNGGDQRMAGLPCVTPGTKAATSHTSSSTTTSTHRTTTPPSGTHTTPSSPPGVPLTVKPAQSWDCMINAGPGCKPNGGHQAVQNNTTSHVNTGGTPGAPAQAPTPAPAQTTAPSGGSTGSGGTTGGTQPTNAPQVGVTGTPPPGTFTPPSGG